MHSSKTCHLRHTQTHEIYAPAGPGTTTEAFKLKLKYFTAPSASGRVRESTFRQDPTVKLSIKQHQAATTVLLLPELHGWKPAGGLKIYHINLNFPPSKSIPISISMLDPRRRACEPPETDEVRKVRNNRPTQLARRPPSSLPNTTLVECCMTPLETFLDPVWLCLSIQLSTSMINPIKRVAIHRYSLCQSLGTCHAMDPQPPASSKVQWSVYIKRYQRPSLIQLNFPAYGE